MPEIKIPEGMLKAAREAGEAHGGVAWDSERGMACYPVAIEAALRWQMENPIVPTDEEALSMVKAKEGFPFDSYEWVRWGAVEWQRRMFLAPTPEIPQEIKSLVEELFHNGCGQEAERLVLTSAEGCDLGGWCKKVVMDRIREAFEKAATK